MIAYAGIVQVFGTAASDGEFVRTLLLLALAAAFVASATAINVDEQYRIWLGRAAATALYVNAAYTVAQFALAAAGVDSLYNPWGSRQFLYEYDVEAQFGLIRAPGFYLEPSFNGLVAIALFATCANLRYRVGPTLIAATSVAVASRSMAAILALGLIALVCTATGPRMTRLLATVRHRPSAYLLAAGAAAVSAPYLLNRAASLFEVGSSLNYRLVAPLQVLADTFREAPLGRPLGSMEAIVGKYELLNGAEFGSTLDNGIYLLLFYFGIPGLMVLLATATVLMYLTAVGNGVAVRRVGIPLVMATFNGGIFLPDFTLLLCLVIISSHYYAAASGHRNSDLKFRPPAHRQRATAAVSAGAAANPECEKVVTARSAQHH